MTDDFGQNNIQDGLPPESTGMRFATIGTVHSDGVTLIFAGEPDSIKHYKCNQYCKFAVGQQVCVQKDSGTYIVLFPVGDPQPVAADTALSAQTAISAEKATSATKAAQVENSSRPIYLIRFRSAANGKLQFTTTYSTTWYNIL